jgi:non-heme chloroperoxidase
MAPLRPPLTAIAQPTVNRSLQGQGAETMMFVTTKDGTQIFYKDWGPKNAQPLVFHHGRPLSSDDWDAQLLFFVAQGFRVVAHDRRGHGRSTQVSDGHDMDHYAADASAVAEHLDLKNAVHIGHSTGGGEVTRYVAKLHWDRAIDLSVDHPCWWPAVGERQRAPRRDISVHLGERGNKFTNSLRSSEV